MNIVEKVVEFYNDLFIKNIDPLLVDFDFLLLKTNGRVLMNIIDTINVKKSKMVGRSINYIYVAAIKSLSSSSVIIVENSIKTLLYFLYALFKKNINFNDLKLLLAAGNDEFDSISQLFISSLLPLISSSYNSNIRSLAASLLFLISFPSSSIHHNPFITPFIHTRSNSLLCLIYDLLEDSIVSKLDGLLLMCMFNHFQQYDGQSPFQIGLINAENKDIEKLDTAINDVNSFSLQFSSNNDQLLTFALNYAMSYIYTESPESKLSAEIKEDNAFLFTSISHLSLYNCLYHQRKFITTCAKFKRIESIVVPTQVPSSIISFLTTSSKVMQTGIKDHSNSIRLCLLIYHVMSQDAASCVLTHDCSLISSLPPISLFSNLTLQWRSYQGLPIISIIFSNLCEFIIDHSDKILIVSDPLISLIKLALEILTRFLSYEFEMHYPDSPMKIHLFSCFILMMKTCSKLFQALSLFENYSNNDVLKFFKYNLTVSEKWFYVADGTSSQNREISALLFEISLQSDNLQQILVKVQFEKDSSDIASKLIEEFKPIGSLSLYLRKLIPDQFASSKFDTVRPNMSVFDVIYATAQSTFYSSSTAYSDIAIDLIAKNLSKFSIPTVTISSRFIPYVENPTEVSFFNSVVLELMLKFKKLSIDPNYCIPY